MPKNIIFWKLYLNFFSVVYSFLLQLETKLMRAVTLKPEAEMQGWLITLGLSPRQTLQIEM